MKTSTSCFYPKHFLYLFPPFLKVLTTKFLSSWLVTAHEKRKAPVDWKDLGLEVEGGRKNEKGRRSSSPRATYDVGGYAVQNGGLSPCHPSFSSIALRWWARYAQEAVRHVNKKSRTSKMLDGNLCNKLKSHNDRCSSGSIPYNIVCWLFYPSWTPPTPCDTQIQYNCSSVQRNRETGFRLRLAGNRSGIRCIQEVGPSCIE